MSFFDKFKAKGNRFFGDESIYDPLSNECCFGADTFTATGDGSTVNYTLDTEPYASGQEPFLEMVFVNGALVDPSAWSRTDNVITLSAAPAAGQAIVVYSFYK